MKMAGRWTASLVGASAASLLAGAAVARSVGGDLDTAVAAGGFSSVCFWAVLAPLVIAQRSPAKAWLVALAASALAGLWAWGS